ncbi:MAG: hypothetical protein A2651_02665 [Candidatus Yanofskybacteria bacterium RIFCSPHIGHO2_01_FULL_42_12]|uniref:Uncharacterized protein n=1 Tax=Candidatus Yanofskybacteria bacterium RIFCSPLOWO2_01_FULL_42_49 TaxID=1802694 RepID=A0A1F8GDB6_9BACT|nr:MAG: hypothetical protein A2651_02665 [Candidatus Yanofskybacteria bacterium RIFCSPHIGHO2_01_FULL_42_12]OGN22738.1 MAG: hypothetical protein A2918_01305 [Candidatus Yanofskybacteria bacterium RIFCSPLOWO2_01_FULL_42_49]
MIWSPSEARRHLKTCNFLTGSVFLKQFEPISPPVAAVARNLKNLNRNSELKTAKEPVKNIGSNHINKENFHLRNRRNAVFLLLFT